MNDRLRILDIKKGRKMFAYFIVASRRLSPDKFSSFCSFLLSFSPNLSTIYIRLHNLNNNVEKTANRTAAPSEKAR